jgi:hypothetical protein
MVTPDETLFKQWVIVNIIHEHCIMFKIPLWMAVGRDREWKVFCRHMWE